MRIDYHALAAIAALFLAGIAQAATGRSSSPAAALGVLGGVCDLV